MVREAREMVKNGVIGQTRQIQCDFASGPFMVEETDMKKKHWRFKPDFMGKEAILGEIGTHAYNLANFVTSEKPLRISPPNKYIDNKASNVVTEVIIVLDNVSFIEIFVNS